MVYLSVLLFLTNTYWPGRIIHVPLDENDSFVGREDVIGRLMDTLLVKKRNRVALFGMGGVGKTQVALRMAHMLEYQDPGCSILWLPAFSMAAFDQACTELVRKLGLPSNDDDDAKELIQRHLSLEGVGRWLLILDNADSEDVLQGSRGIPGIRTYLPRNRYGQVLITTRWRKIAVDFAKTNVIPVAEMELRDAKNLLRRLVLCEHLAWEDYIVDELLRLLTCLPLAIVQAAAYMNIFEVSIKEYVRLCRHSQRDMMELMRSQYQDDTLYDESQGAVATTSFISFAQLRKYNPVAEKLLLFITWIEPQAIPLSLLPEFESELEKVKAVGTLKSYGFLQPRPEEGLFDMHNLVHMVMQFWAQIKGLLRKRRRRAWASCWSIYVRRVGGTRCMAITFTSRTSCIQGTPRYRPNCSIRPRVLGGKMFL